MKAENNQSLTNRDAPKRVLDKRLDSIGWALFFIWTGITLLAPENWFPEGAWLMGVGLIILGEGGIRYIYRLKISSFWIVIGSLALVFGVSEFYHLNLLVLAVLLIIIGFGIILKPWKESDWFSWCDEISQMYCGMSRESNKQS